MDGAVLASVAASATAQRAPHSANRLREGLGGRGLGWSEVAERVEAIVQDYVATSQRRSASAPARELWNHIGASFGGGKRLRPQLVWLSYAAFGGDDAESCAAAGAAFEFLHGALVVHDDVIDRDTVRRGRPNIAGTYAARAQARGIGAVEASHLGSSAAIIAGDLLLAASYRILERAASDSSTRTRLLDLLHGAMADAASGELADVLMAHASGTVDEVLEMERLKTAVYSFEAPLRAGAVLAGAIDAEVEAVGRVGSLIGIAYQVIDDVLGTFGDPRQTGKPVTSDLREGKLTVLTAFAGRDPEVAAYLEPPRDGRDDGGPEARGGMTLEDLASGDLASEDPAREDLAREALHRAGADGYALNLAHSLVTEALDEARRCDLPAPLRSELTRLCNHVLHRER